jgi:serine/threonine-protein kinase HipA
MRYSHVQAISVFIWGRRVGVLAAPDGKNCVFEYDPEFRKSGLEIAPIAMPLSKAVYYADEFELPRRSLSGLPGVFADSLPDSFGNRLVRKWMESQGIDVTSISPLDRLAYVGSRGIGALTYEPQARSDNLAPTALDMRRLVEEAHLALNARLEGLSATDALGEIIRLGSSAGGAQAKAVVGWNRETGGFLAGDANLPEGFQHWILKFAPHDDPGAGEREFAIYTKALRAGITMSESRLLELDGSRHFMTRRFDREGSRRFHVQTLCALQHLPPGGPRQLCSYDLLYDTAETLGLAYEDKEELFRRMAFNVYNKEMDDHTKNFSFMMMEDGSWHLAPAYDLTGCHFSAEDSQWNDWQNQHALSVNGKFSSISDEDMLMVAERYAIGTASTLLAQVRDAFA